MSRYAFTTWNNKTMSSVRQEITSVAMTKPLDASTNNFMELSSVSISTARLVAIESGANASTWTINTNAFLRATGSTSGENLTLTGNLTVKGNTTLGDSSADTISLIGTVTGATASFTEVSVTTLKVGGQVYKPFSAGTTAPNTNLLWIDTTTTVPVLRYHNGSTWVSIGAVFG